MGGGDGEDGTEDDEEDADIEVDVERADEMQRSGDEESTLRRDMVDRKRCRSSSPSSAASSVFAANDEEDLDEDESDEGGRSKSVRH